MANRRAIVKRRKAVRNTKKITRTMQLIATARFQAAMSRAVASRPYTDKLAELVADLSGVAGDYVHPLMEAPSSANRAAMVILTSNRGFCGGYNANVLRTAAGQMAELAGEGVEADVYMVGKKGTRAFLYQGKELRSSYTEIGDKPQFAEVEPIAQELIDRFVAGEVSAVFVSYMRFYSAGRQRPEIAQLLPLVHAEPEATSEEPPERAIEFEIRPEPAELLSALLPATVRIRLFQAFLDANVSEQVARMVAMKAATEASGDMIKRLTRQYNRARQAAITTELMEIIGGAEALKG